MRILVVAPTAVDLEYANDEMSRITNTLKPSKILHGDVQSGELLNELINPYDLVWFITHGYEDGILLSDGILSIDRLTQYLQQQSPAVVLNTCDGDGIAIMVHNATKAPVIFSRADILDRDAFEFATLLATNIDNNLSLTDAFELSAPPHSNKYSMIGKESSKITDSQRLEMLIHSNRKNTSELYDELRRKMDCVEKQTQSINEKVRHLEENNQPRLTKNMVMIWTGGYVLYSFLFLTAAWQVRELLEIDTWDYLIIWLIVIFLSYIAFAYGLGFRFHIAKNNDA